MRCLDVAHAEIEEATNVFASRLSLVHRHVNVLAADYDSDSDSQDEPPVDNPASDTDGGPSAGEQHIVQCNPSR